MKKHHATDWFYFTNFDKDYRLADQDDMPSWDIVENPSMLEYSYSSNKIVQELDVDPELAYEYDDTDRLMDPIDLSKFGKYKSRGDKIKLMDINDIPTDFDWERTQNELKTEKWAAFRFTPQILYQMAHMRRENKILRRQNPMQPLPSLWAYYQTLPTWATDHPLVRYVLMGLEVPNSV